MEPVEDTISIYAKDMKQSAEDTSLNRWAESKLTPEEIKRAQSGGMIVGLAAIAIVIFLLLLFLLITIAGWLFG